MLLPQCGTDATNAFVGQHGEEKDTILAEYAKNFALDLELDTRTVSVQELTLHSHPWDCWIVFNQTEVYNVTEYYYDTIHGKSFWECGNAQGTLKDASLLAMPGLRTKYMGALVVPDGVSSLQAQQALELSSSITMDQVQQHNTPEDCWVIYFNEVYDVTKYAPYHPGGQEFVLNECGKDGTENFAIFHDYEELETIARDFVGMLSPTADATVDGAEVDTEAPTIEVTSEVTLKETVPPLVEEETVPPLVDMSQVQQHDTSDDCWVVYFNEVYDMTKYAPHHPGGKDFVLAGCGEDDTENFSVFHEYEELDILAARDFMGMLAGPAAAAEEVVDTEPPVSIPQSPPPTAAPATTEPATTEEAAPALVTVDELSRHNKRTDCWVSYFSEVYDVTEYAPNHPGGAALVTSNCGRDDTESFSVFHEYDQLEDIWDYYVGMLRDASDEPVQAEEPMKVEDQSEEEEEDTTEVAPELQPPQQSLESSDQATPKPEVPSSAPATATTVTVAPAASPQSVSDSGLVHYSELQKHATPNDCWVSYFDEVYDMTVRFIQKMLRNSLQLIIESNKLHQSPIGIRS